MLVSVWLFVCLYLSVSTDVFYGVCLSVSLSVCPHLAVFVTVLYLFLFLSLALVLPRRFVFFCLLACLSESPSLVSAGLSLHFSS